VIATNGTKILILWHLKIVGQVQISQLPSRLFCERSNPGTLFRSVISLVWSNISVCEPTMSSLNRESVDTYKGSLAQAPILPIAAPRLPALGAPRFHASAPKPASTLPAAGPKRRGPQKDQSARKTEDVDGKKRYKESYQQLRNAQRRAKRAQERIEKL
jgi:hypothetical protein